MIKYFCDRCGKEIKIEDGYTIPPRKKNENGIMHHGGFLICQDCYHKWCEVLDRVSDNDFVHMTDNELESYRCDFKVGDGVITSTGKVGIITNICTCNRCKERGFYEPTAEMNDGETKYITISDKENGFKSYYAIGNHRFGNLDEASVLSDIATAKQELAGLEAQFLVVQKLKNNNN